MIKHTLFNKVLWCHIKQDFIIIDECNNCERYKFTTLKNGIITIECGLENQKPHPVR